MNEFALLHLKEVDRLSKLSFIPRSFNPSKTDRKSSLQPLAGDLINSVSDYENEGGDDNDADDHVHEEIIDIGLNVKGDDVDDDGDGDGDDEDDDNDDDGDDADYFQLLFQRIPS